MNSLLSIFPWEGVNAIGYADDVILIVNGDDPPTMALLMERALRKVCECGDHRGLAFRVDKTTTVMFHRGCKGNYSPELNMGGRCLQYLHKMTYLGIMFRKRLSWTDHIKSRVRKCTYHLKKQRIWRPCPIAQSEERSGRSDSITDLAGMKILLWVRIHPLSESL